MSRGNRTFRNCSHSVVDVVVQLSETMPMKRSAKTGPAAVSCEDQMLFVMCTHPFVRRLLTTVTLILSPQSG